MQRSASTVVCVVGDVPDALAPVLGSHTTYVVHDEDPLTTVADAWARLFDEAGPIPATVRHWYFGVLHAAAPARPDGPTPRSGSTAGGRACGRSRGRTG